MVHEPIWVVEYAAKQFVTCCELFRTEQHCSFGVEYAVKQASMRAPIKNKARRKLLNGKY
jgi:hypothetical protein